MGTDWIVLKSGEMLRGVDVEEETLEAIRYREGTEAKSVRTVEVLEVLHLQPPERFAEATEKLREGRYQEAAKLLRQSAAEAGAPRWLRAHADFQEAGALKADCELVGINYASAVDRCKQFLREHPTDRRVPEATFLVGECLAREGKELAEAEGHFRRLAEGNFGPEYRRRGEYGVATVAIGRRFFDEAQERLGKLAEECQREGDRALWVRIAEAELQADSLEEDGRPTARGLLRSSWQNAWESVPEAASLLCAIGEELLESRSRKDRQLALKAYLRVLSYHSGQAIAYCRALSGAARCLERLGDARRAKTLRDKLRTQYPASQWAKR